MFKMRKNTKMNTKKKYKTTYRKKIYSINQNQDEKHSGAQFANANMMIISK